MTVIFDGRTFVKSEKGLLRKKVESLKKKGVNPCLASIFLNTDPGSVLYTRLKSQAAEDLGIKFLSFEIDFKHTREILKLIDKVNKNDSIHGLLVQKPSGSNDFSVFDWARISLAISPSKDIDCLTPENLGLLMIGRPRFLPATVSAVLKVIKSTNVDLKGKKVVIIGASEILGKPLSHILTDQGSTVTLLHKLTEDLSTYTKKADILISATGQTGIVGKKLVKRGSIVIDVGAPKGDVMTKKVLSKVSFISPVPGGVGPMTVNCLLENLINSLIEKDRKS